MKTATQTINTKALRANLGAIIERVKRGASFLVLHRGRLAFQIVPPESVYHSLPPLKEDPLYRTRAVGRSKDGLSAADHDPLLYGREADGLLTTLLC
jgi:antitoxin (DNA-binding transcriptional repressor) of toxin-antitoxin stability system